MLRELKFVEITQWNLSVTTKRPVILHEIWYFMGGVSTLRLIVTFSEERILLRDIVTKFVKSSVELASIYAKSLTVLVLVTSVTSLVHITCMHQHEG